MPGILPITYNPKVKKLDAAREALAAIERVYLRAAGFIDLGNDYWAPPKRKGFGRGQYKYQVYRTGHAINALKVWDRRTATVSRIRVEWLKQWPEVAALFAKK